MLNLFSRNKTVQKVRLYFYGINRTFKGAYWIIQRFLVHYQILHLLNIAIAILDFSLLLPIKLSLFQLLRQLLLALKGDSEEES